MKHSNSTLLSKQQLTTHQLRDEEEEEGKSQSFQEAPSMESNHSNVRMITYEDLNDYDADNQDGGEKVALAHIQAQIWDHTMVRYL